MPLRILSLILMSAVLAGAAPSKVSKEKKKPAKHARTWKAVVDYVLKNGEDDSVKAPSSRTLGFDSDSVDSRSLSIEDDKSKDGVEHNIDVIYDKDDKGVLRAKEIVIGTIKVKASPSGNEIDSFRIRISTEGALIRGMHATGLVGQVIQTPLTGSSPDLLRVFKQEMSLYTKEIELSALTK